MQAPGNITASAVPATAGDVLPQFAQINRYWDAAEGIQAAKVLPGEYYVTRHNELITTVLGSCVSACIRDKTNGIGGMNHFMLPFSQSGTPGQWGGTQVNMATRYGNFAMEHLINDILKLGCHRENFEIKVFGGGKVLDAMTDIGKRNADFIRDYLREENLPIAAEDLETEFPRRVVYYPATGRVRIKKLRRTSSQVVSSRESEYAKKISNKPVAGGIDLF